MTAQEWIVLAIAILGVLHGPLAAKLFTRKSGSKGVK